MSEHPNVWIVHENIPYEFGAVRGVFSSEEAAISFAQGMTNAEEITVSRWLLSDIPTAQEEVDVWEKLSQERVGKRLAVHAVG